MHPVSTRIRQAAVAAVCAAGLVLPVMAQHGVARADGDLTISSPDMTAMTTTQVNVAQNDRTTTANQLPPDYAPVVVPSGS